MAAAPPQCKEELGAKQSSGPDILVNTGRLTSGLQTENACKFDLKSRQRTPMSVGPATTHAVDPVVEFREGIKLLKNEYPQKALVRLKRAFESDQHNVYYMSFLGLAIARAQRKWDQASDLCEIAVQLKPTEIQFHLNLGEVYALAGRREKALDKLEHALRLFGNDARLVQARGKVEKRRNPVLSFLGREHSLNRELGKLRHRILKSLGK
jgi:Flp pilus assembly protein TadD